MKKIIEYLSFFFSPQRCVGHWIPKVPFPPKLSFVASQKFGTQILFPKQSWDPKLPMKVNLLMLDKKLIPII